MTGFTGYEVDWDSGFYAYYGLTLKSSLQPTAGCAFVSVGGDVPGGFSPRTLWRQTTLRAHGHMLRDDRYEHPFGDTTVCVMNGFTPTAKVLCTSKCLPRIAAVAP
jgi:hypothetical protein